MRKGNVTMIYKSYKIVPKHTSSYKKRWPIFVYIMHVVFIWIQEYKNRKKNCVEVIGSNIGKNTS